MKPILTTSLAILLVGLALVPGNAHGEATNSIPARRLLKGQDRVTICHRQVGPESITYKLMTTPAHQWTGGDPSGHSKHGGDCQFCSSIPSTSRDCVRPCSEVNVRPNEDDKTCTGSCSFTVNVTVLDCRLRGIEGATVNFASNSNPITPSAVTDTSGVAVIQGTILCDGTIPGVNGAQQAGSSNDRRLLQTLGATGDCPQVCQRILNNGEITGITLPETVNPADDGSYSTINANFPIAVGEQTSITVASTCKKLLHPARDPPCSSDPTITCSNVAGAFCENQGCPALTTAGEFNFEFCAFGGTSTNQLPLGFTCPTVPGELRLVAVAATDVCGVEDGLKIVKLFNGVPVETIVDWPDTDNYDETLPCEPGVEFQVIENVGIFIMSSISGQPPDNFESYTEFTPFLIG